MTVLAGDIGGTKTLLQIADFDRDRYRVLAQRRFENEAYTSLSAIIEEFMGEQRPKPRLKAACLGVAGPILDTGDGERVRLTNLPWCVDSKDLRASLGIPKVRLINDLQAAGYGMQLLAPQDFITLQAGEPQAFGTRALIGAGTGLGQGLLIWQHDHYEPHPTEGGHADFAPTDAVQIDLLKFLLRDHPRASYERVLSGQGLVNIYHFLCARHGKPETISHDVDDHAAAIAVAAHERKDPLASEALEIFAQIYGAQAGNLALTVMATGGVYITGGIAPKILPWLTDGRFLKAFLHKGRMSALAARMPVHIVTNPAIGLMGTALAASRL